MDSAFKPKKDMLHEFLDGRVVGGTLSQLANYSDLFKRMSEAVFLVERNSYRVLECNEAALNLLASRESEVLGFELPHLLKAETYLKGLLLQEFNSVDFVYHNAHGDERVFEISATTLKILDYIEVVQFIARDVTAVKRAERDLREMNEALTRLSTTDEMTGLRNYRYFKEVLQSVHHSAHLQNEKYGIIFIDVDHFKKFNDRNGHPAGDEVLRRVASILKSCARSQDLPARYGGEEFVMVCRHSSLEETLAVAEMVRVSIEAAEFPFGEFQPLGRVTVSVGVSAFPAVQGTFEVLLESADQALYASKEKGRNRVSHPELGGTDSKKKAS
ncbi:MAG: sensor domain-containing diguanylate cyclase [Bdellovibrionales bacterium]|nr:sensor domain-containing diguanylate cyclase [Bdellovibrionales bacterium]